MPDDGKRYEMVRGKLIEIPPPGIMHEVVTHRFSRRMGDFVDRHDLGIITGGAGIHIEQGPDTVRAPDCVFISHEHVAGPLPDSGYVVGLIPDLVVEVISPDYPAALAESRAQMWLGSGVGLVLLAQIATKEVVAMGYDETARRFNIDDTFMCGPVLPSFAGPVANIFNHR